MLGRSIVLASLATATTTMAQLPSMFPSSLYGLNFSPMCQQAILSAFTNGSLSQCFPVMDLLPAIVSNASIVPALDTFMSDLCYSEPCSNATLTQAASTILSGCASDLQGEHLSNSTVMDAFSAYPIVREVLCLKTSTPYTNKSYGGSLGNAPIPISSAYNETNGTFCVTSVLTQLSAYFKANLTLPFIESIVDGGNRTALGLAERISPTILCNDCIFGAIDVVEEAYPTLGDVPLSAIYGYFNRTTSVNTTINGLVNGTCAYVPLVVNENGTLPSNVTVSILNSTFPYNVTDGHSASSAALKRGWGSQ